MSQALASVAVDMCYAEGDVIAQQGEAANALFILTSGQVQTTAIFRGDLYSLGLFTPAINEGCTRSLRISQNSRRAPLQPVSKTQVPCTPYHPPNIAGVIEYFPHPSQ